MRTLTTLTLALFLAAVMVVLSPARDANAVPTIYLQWQETGSSVVNIPWDWESDVVHLNVIIHDTDGLGLLAYDWNVQWNPAIAATRAVTSAPPGWSTGSAAVLGPNYFGDETVATTNPAYYGASFTWVMATITFHVASRWVTGWVWLGTTLGGQSSAVDGPGTTTLQYASAKVYHPPEPGTTALLALGLLGLMLVGHRNSS